MKYVIVLAVSVSFCINSAFSFGSHKPIDRQQPKPFAERQKSFAQRKAEWFSRLKGAKPVQRTRMAAPRQLNHTSTTSSFSSAWTPLNPPSTDSNGYNLFPTINTVSVIDSLTAIGTGGRVIKTTDRGVHWQQINQAYSLSNAQFIDANNGWAFDNTFYTLDKTTDGGASWSQVFAPPYNFRSFVLVDSLHLFALTFKFFPVDSIYVYRTVDGGATWDVPFKTQSSIGTNIIKFLDSLNGWVTTGPYLFSTTDGGNTWNQGSIDAGYSYIIDISFATPQIGWAATDKYDNVGHLLKTTDGGGTWNETFTDSLVGFYTVLFKDSLNGVINGYATAYPTLSSDEILRTTDGGATWSPHSFPVPYYLNGPFYSHDGSTGYFFDGNGYLFRTTDAGAQWENLSGGLPPFDFGAVSFVSPNEGWIFGPFSFDVPDWGAYPYAFVYHTSNGGGSWEQTYLDSSRQFFGGQFVTPTKGFAVGFDQFTGEGGIYKSTDAGQSWNRIYVMSGFSRIAFQFLDTLNGFYCEYDNQTLYRTTDGGASWQQTSLPDQFESIQFLSKKIGYGTAEGNLFYKTGDGGATWKSNVVADTSLNGEFITTLFFQNAQVGWAGTDGGSLLSTTNGGSRWLNLCYWYGDCFAFDELISSMSFVSPTIGSILNEGYIETVKLTGINSYDDLAFSSNPFPLTAMQFPSAQVGFAVGEGGTIARFSINGSGSSALFRTFMEDSLTVKAVKLKKTKTKGYPLPNSGNVRDETFKRVFPAGIVLGIARPDSPKTYSWVRYKKSSNAQKGFPESGGSRGLDSIFLPKPKAILGEFKNPKATKYHNHLLGELLALKISIGASDAGICPVGLGEVVYYDSTYPSSPGNNKTIRAIALFADSQLTFWKGKQPSLYTDLDTVISRLNRAFSGPMDTFSVVPLSILGVRPIDSVSYLRPNLNPYNLPYEPVSYIAAEEDQPQQFSLEQNYPNPFNPTTTIRFSLPEISVVTLKIYNILGQEVKTLADHEEMEDGVHEIEFNAAHFASGLYFYKIIADGMNENGVRETFSQVKKMLLVK